MQISIKVHEYQLLAAFSFSTFTRDSGWAAESAAPTAAQQHTYKELSLQPCCSAGTAVCCTSIPCKLLPSIHTQTPPSHTHENIAALPPASLSMFMFIISYKQLPDGAAGFLSPIPAAHKSTYAPVLIAIVLSNMASVHAFNQWMQEGLSCAPSPFCLLWGCVLS